ncbi:hypothetical protein C8J56DRAFT_920793 [Mycena floridula]|nr:hypothetical protein C8J56DRAFT_920793 [Mycena floridula]
MFVLFRRTYFFRTMSQYPSTVEAVALNKIGGLEVLEKMTLPFPKVEPGHVVVKVEYIGVNFIDVYYRQGLYPLSSFPAVIGKEAAGTIVGLPSDSKVLEDADYKKRNFAVGGRVAVDFLGAHASYISLPWSRIYPVPDSVPAKIAAASTLQCLSAVSFFEEAYEVKKGDTLLIHTIAGYIGATVIGTTSTKEKAELAKAHGADHVILYPVENTVDRVLEITNGAGVEAVFDGVGKDTFDGNFKVLKRKGTLVSLGNASGAVAPFAPIKLVEKNLKLLRPTMTNYTVTPAEMLYYGTKVFDLVGSGVLKINVFKEYPFTTEGIREAQKDLTGGKTTGKLVIKVDTRSRL